MPALQFCIFPIELHLSGKGQITLRATGVNLPLLRTLEQKVPIFYEPTGHRGEKGKRDRSEKSLEVDWRKLNQLKSQIKSHNGTRNIAMCMSEPSLAGPESLIATPSKKLQCTSCAPILVWEVLLP